MQGETLQHGVRAAPRSAATDDLKAVHDLADLCVAALSAGASPDGMREIATRYGQTPHPGLIAELSELYGVSP